MLPRFSIALRWRTSTPWRAIICAPASEVDAQDGREQFGAQADGERDRKQQRLHRRPSVQHMHDEDDKDHHQHHAGQQVAEPADAAVEFGFRGTQCQRMRNGAELRSRARSPRSGSGRCRSARWCRGRRNSGRSRRPAAAATGPARFSTGKLSPVRTASLTKKSVASRITPSAGTRLPADSSTTSPGTTSSVGTWLDWPSRSTRARERMRACRAAAAASAVYSRA